jgi:hypothetical protein
MSRLFLSRNIEDGSPTPVGRASACRLVRFDGNWPAWRVFLSRNLLKKGCLGQRCFTSMRRGWETPAGWSSVRQIRPMLPIAATAVDATSRAGWCTRRRSQCHPTKRVLVRLTRWAGWGRGEIRMMCGLIIARRALVRGRAADQQPHGTSDGHRQPHGRARPRPMYRPLWNIIIRTEILNWLRFTYDLEIGSA